MMEIRARYQFAFTKHGAEAGVDSAWKQEKLEASVSTISTTKKLLKKPQNPQRSVLGDVLWLPINCIEFR